MAAAALAVTTGCVQEPPPVSDRVAEYYENHKDLQPLASDERLEAVFLGDSYTQGTGASAPANRWVNRVAAAMDWRFVNLGRGGTGYLATAGMAGCGLEHCTNYEGMIPAAVAESPDIVFIAGGQNDFTAFNESRGAVVKSIENTFASIRAKLPKAKIIAVGPSTPWGVNPDVETFDKLVQDAAASVQAQYVSLIKPDIIVDSMVLKDGGLVNDAGHKAIALRVIAALR
ncbi:SGNH/GDSL hydrolase family protein [Arthrobacter sp. AFG20]|uniref:SGNH/GDSL hydrolase family protein n=1 Tax=Arthrobacter sp. AFG20 TaxID=1688671 RepID=UPI0011AFCE98|nr:SGNH/GDSL hydrolase family protein [Arthrobacter sp. AFG20]